MRIGRKIAACLMFMLTLAIREGAQGGGPSLQFLRDKIISNQRALGNADVYFDLELKLFDQKGDAQSRLPKHSKLQIVTQYARDGSLSAKLSGDLPATAAKFYLIKDGGLLRYFEHAGSAYNQVEATSYPDWTIDPFDCLRTGKHVTILEVLLDPKLTVKEISHDKLGDVTLKGELPTKIPDLRAIWTVVFSKENDFLPSYFRGSVLGGKYTNEVRLLDGNALYRKIQKTGSFFPASWKRVTYSLEEKLITSEEMGEVSKIDTLSPSDRDTSFAHLPDRTRLIDAVARKVALVKAEVQLDHTFARLRPFVFGFSIVSGLVVCLTVYARMRRRK